MSIPRYSLSLLVLLSGCAGPQGGWPGLAWPWPAGADAAVASGHEARRYASFNFEWLISGDPEIMPVQVFDDGERTWLQFQPEGAWPAVFEAGEGGWRPVPYLREGPYMVLQGVYDRLELRGGHLRGAVRRGGAALAAGDPSARRVAPTPPPGGGDAGAQAGLQPRALVPGTMSPPRTGEAASVPGTAVALPQAAPPADLSDAVPPSAEAVDPASMPGRFAVSPADHTMRQALERWASLAGWTFSSEHWAVDVDIPLVGDASFDTDFKSAVRELLAATEMGERPLQPCFYSNRVVRVVAYAQACDRRQGMGAMS